MLHLREAACSAFESFELAFCFYPWNGYANIFQISGVDGLAALSNPEAHMTAFQRVYRGMAAMLSALAPVLLRSRGVRVAVHGSHISSITHNLQGSMYYARSVFSALLSLSRSFSIELQRHCGGLLINAIIHKWTPGAPVPLCGITTGRENAEALLRLLRGATPDQSGSLVGDNGVIPP